MNLLRKILRYARNGILAVIALLLINIGVHRLRGPSAEQETALAKLAEVNATPAHGDNAFPLYWLMRYDVADDQIEAITAEDARRAKAMHAAGESLSALIPEDRPRLPAPANGDPGLCDVNGEFCLARVASNPDATRELLARYPRTLQRARMLEAKNSFRIELPITIDTPLLNPGMAQHLRLSELALAWHDGRHREAIAGTCRNAASWRLRRHDSNSLIFSMIAIRFLDSATQLFADMLAALPSSESLPEDCIAAFSPIVEDDVSLCSEMAGEWLMSVDALRSLENPKSDSFADRVSHSLGMPVFYSAGQTAATRAQHDFELYCSARGRQDALQDRVIEPKAASEAIFECASNAIGCILMDAGLPVYTSYSQHLLDSAAHLRLAASLIWLRKTSGDPRPLATRFAERPAHLRSGERASGVSDDGKLLWVGNQYDKRDARFSLALTPAAGMQ